MKYSKKSTYPITILLIISQGFFLSACAHRDKPAAKNCKIIEVARLKKSDILPGKGTIVGGAGGATAGGVIGGASGLVAGVAVTTMTFGLGAPLIPFFMGAGAASGAAIGGGTGLGAGYIYDHSQKAGKWFYEYKVSCDNQANFVVRKLQKNPFQVSEPVFLYWNKEQIIIKGKPKPKKRSR